MKLSELAEPFEEKYIEWRIMRSGSGAKGPWAMLAAYLDARGVQNRLDAVCGPGGWQVEYKSIDGGMLCGISIEVEPGTWVTKWDGAQNTDVEAIKGGISGAFKRAAAVWGIGRYLYDLGEQWAKVSENGANQARLPDKTAFKWDPPPLPQSFLPQAAKGKKSTKKEETEKKPDSKMVEVAAGMMDLQGEAGTLLQTLVSMKTRADIKELVDYVKAHATMPQQHKDTLIASATARWQETPA